jgi:hypothetical protein
MNLFSLLLKNRSRNPLYYWRIFLGKLHHQFINGKFQYVIWETGLTLTGEVSNSKFLINWFTKQNCRRLEKEGAFRYRTRVFHLPGQSCWYSYPSLYISLYSSIAGRNWLLSLSASEELTLSLKIMDTFDSNKPRSIWSIILSLCRSTRSRLETWIFSHSPSRTSMYAWQSLLL